MDATIWVNLKVIPVNVRGYMLYNSIYIMFSQRQNSSDEEPISVCQGLSVAQSMTISDSMKAFVMVMELFLLTKLADIGKRV
jgi:hypothetical protein